MIYFSWFAYDFAYDGVAFSKSYVHMVSYRFSFCFTIPYGMMWTHFSYYVYGEYEFKNFKHYFSVNARESTAILTTKTCWKNQKFISFGQMMQ